MPRKPTFEEMIARVQDKDPDMARFREAVASSTATKTQQVFKDLLERGCDMAAMLAMPFEEALKHLGGLKREEKKAAEADPAKQVKDA